MPVSDEIDLIVENALSDLHFSGKAGKRLLQPTIGRALEAGGYQVDFEDSQGFLASRLPVWRSKDTGEVEPTAARRKIDIVVYSGFEVVALIETESDLNDLRKTGVCSRSGHYDVYSIAKGADGNFFDSYKSLERMAAAAFYAHFSKTMDDEEGYGGDLVRLLSAVCSKEASAHNPKSLHMCLVSGSCRPMDRGILSARLDSLNASLICAR